jgi:hypothetical protein
VALALAVGLFVAVAGVSGGAGWAVRDRADRQKKAAVAVRSTLDRARELRGQGRIPEAQAAVQAAGQQLPGAGEDVRREYDQVKADVEVLAAEEAARLQALSSPTSAARACREAFQAYGLPVLDLPAEEAARRITSSDLAPQLVNALDGWARWADPPERARLVAVAQAADPDDWRKSVRQAVLDGDEKALTAMARGEKVDGLPTASVLLLVSALRDTGPATSAFAYFQRSDPGGPTTGLGREGESLAVEVLRRAQPRRPDDFWINLELGVSLLTQVESTSKDAEDAVGYLRVAQAFRPRSVEVRGALGLALLRRGSPDEAERELRACLTLTPNQGWVYQGPASPVTTGGTMRGPLPPTARRWSANRLR